MEALLERLVDAAVAVHPAFLVVYLIAVLAILTKGADILVDEAVRLARLWGIPKVVIGATFVSLGTTTPETAVSVMAALKGDPGLALGNAVGSIIADTGLILGIACLISPPPLDRSVVNRQGWIQTGSALLLVALAILFGGRLPRGVGFLFLAALVVYVIVSIRWSREGGADVPDDEAAPKPASGAWSFAKLVFGIVVVLLASRMLIPGVHRAAVMFHVPEDIIAATLVALGTSMPELVTAVTASLKKHGEVALGNVIGADILNVLFVTGAACAATPGGLDVGANFFRVHFPFMIAILLLFRAGVWLSGTHLSRKFGALLLTAYVAYLFRQAFAL